MSPFFPKDPEPSVRETPEPEWKRKLASPEQVLAQIEPGMSIFLGTGVAEPRTLVRHLMESGFPNLQDLELIQIVSIGDAISVRRWDAQKYRLKTFFAGYIANQPVSEGRVDLIPARFCCIPRLVEDGFLDIAAAFVQVTPPDAQGYCSLGVSVDAARHAMARAKIVVGEIQPQMPRTHGDTFVHVNDFHFLVEATEPLLFFPRPVPSPAQDKVAANVATLIENGSCLSFSVGPIFDALVTHLSHRRHLGIHSPFFTDAAMDLVRSGAVDNRNRGPFKGKCLTSYALGSGELMRWLDRNPLVEFQGIDVVGNPELVSTNEKYHAILPARMVDLAGHVAFHHGRSNVGIGAAEASEFINGASMSKGGRTIVALTSRNLQDEARIVVDLGDAPNQYTNREKIDVVVTEYGAAYLTGRSLRERALALIDVAHPEDRAELVRKAKEANIVYRDQIYLAESAHLYPHDVAATEYFKDGKVRFRAIKPSDEEQMRHLFYRFSKESVYYRYFSPVKTMPHAKMQEYVNVDYGHALSVVGLVGEPGQGKIIAEGRFVRLSDRPWADVAFIVDEQYHGLGIASYLFLKLVRHARQRGIQGFTADVLATNKPMLKVFEKSPGPVHSRFEEGAYHLEMPFTE
jgi:acyl-CoA hydrolase/GNAT superfamily N-acetyltransferase